MQAVQGSDIYALTNGGTHVAVHLFTCVCIAFCTCTPRLSSTLYSLLGLYLSVFLVEILTHPRLYTVSVVAPYRAVNLGCGLEVCGVCVWHGHACVPLYLATAMHSRVGRFRQAQAMHMSLASVLHTRVGHIRQALARHMYQATVMHISTHVTTPAPHGNSQDICTYIYARGHVPDTRTCPAPSMPPSLQDIIV